ncbi:hypothetical protein [Paraburkholderia sediminicola]|uniref:hypothetical protein n=1 Tax=Paraburkholderia sediminicola TaxID=458836 RepID=UPI0038BB2638
MKLDSQFSQYMMFHDLTFNPGYRNLQDSDVGLGNGRTCKVWQNQHHDIVASELYDQSGKELGYSVFDPGTGKLHAMVQIAPDGKEIPSRFDGNGMLIPPQQSNGSSGR